MPTPQNHPPSKIPPWLLALLWRLLRIYLLLCLLVTLFQRHLLYHPEVLTPSQVDIQAHAQQLERWRNPAGQPIGMKRLSPRQPAKGQILVTYGNENSAIDCASYADDLQSLGAFDVFILEYPGYEDRPANQPKPACSTPPTKPFPCSPPTSPRISSANPSAPV